MKNKIFKKTILLALVLVPSLSFGQWQLAGNAPTSSATLGTTNNQAFRVITNNSELMNFSPSTGIKFTTLNGTGSGLLQLASDGVASRNGYPADVTKVLNGNGGWSTIASLCGWTLGSGIVVTTQKVGIGVTTPAQALEVSGNGIFSGSVSASSFDVGTVATVQGHLSLSGSVFHHSYDATAGTRNEVYSTDHEYYINSNTSYNLNTILNQGNSGKVGIGTSSPSAKLHVSGGTKLDGGTTVDSLTWGSSFTLKTKTLGGLTGVGFNLPSTSFANFAFPGCVTQGTASIVTGVPGFFESYSSTASGSVVMGHNGSMGLIDSYSSNSSYADLMLNYYCGKNVGVCTGSSGNVYLTASGGKIGMGTNTPTDKVEIKAGAFSTHIGSAQFSGLGNGNSYLGFNVGRTSGGTWKTDGDGGNNGGAVIYGDVSGDLYFSTVVTTGTTGQTGIADATIKNNTRLFISAASGNIGIGTTCTPYALTIEGVLGSREMWVKTTTWCDYVFAADYKLMPLPQLEAYIKANGHLPGIASAEEVIEKGEFSLGEVSKQHLEKIEELTRYVIDINKRLEQLEKENAELKAQINNK